MKKAYAPKYIAFAFTFSMLFFANLSAQQSTQSAYELDRELKNFVAGDIIMPLSNAPVILFKTKGEGVLENGKARIEIDQALIENVQADVNYPMQVMVVMNGDSHGVYVTNKSRYGFVVKELNGGTSSAEFSWYVVAMKPESNKGPTLTQVNYASVSNRL